MKQNISSQMLKGILQGIMLMILAKRPDYGYGISKQINEYGLEDIPKGTIYPLLTAMERRGLIVGKMEVSLDGPDRKYYFVTSEGEQAKQNFMQEWHFLKHAVDKLVEENNQDENQ
ncbi:PadR family transcriptional regulator [Leuconostoc suionicum]|uniref:PadR family transcriptional regulator n=1 Tax=Leuconostoc suionicum TaxID=1511761 RepID=UPI0021A6E15A|nr:PadR family transcriptional regulator [Leuconostoc suionicum]MCT4375850.1 PadR family transcriptional regulator [Leuconostoc suionicum]MDI6650867.1 PadR family transcriptional regulator [Leuconostoc suionicum]MDI6681240.1 PadR family transcriptional regulator [Leuconostoc suionicum]